MTESCDFKIAVRGTRRGEQFRLNCSCGARGAWAYKPETAARQASNHKPARSQTDTLAQAKRTISECAEASETVPDAGD